MERDAFDDAFQRLVVDALARAGFRSKGKTVSFATPELTVALIVTLGSSGNTTVTCASRGAAFYPE